MSLNPALLDAQLSQRNADARSIIETLDRRGAELRAISIDYAQEKHAGRHGYYVVLARWRENDVCWYVENYGGIFCLSVGVYGECADNSFKLRSEAR